MIYRKFNIIFLILLFTILFASVPSADANHPDVCVPGGEWEIFGPETVLFAKCGDDDVRVKIEIYEVDQKSSDPEHISRIRSFCSDPCDFRVKTLVKDIGIKVNDRDIIVDSKAYSKLYNLNGAEIRREKDRYNLMLKGGDTISAYYVKLNFDRAGAEDSLSSCPHYPDKPTQEILTYIQTTKLESTDQRAHGGDAEAQYIMGLRYYYGEGVYQDFVEAIRWYRKAADQGHTDAQYRAGDMVLDGDVVRQDHAEAAHWLRKAADKGHARAQGALAFMHWEGLWVMRDNVQALMWADLAAESGDEEAKRLQSKIAEGMRPSEIEEAQRLAEERRERGEQ